MLTNPPTQKGSNVQALEGGWRRRCRSLTPSTTLASVKVREKAKALGMTLYDLPPYSPNLNPIERVWKVMNEQARNNIYFRLKNEFIETIPGFFQNTWPRLAPSLIDRINDTFQTIEA